MQEFFEDLKQFPGSGKIRIPRSSHIFFVGTRVVDQFFEERINRAAIGGRDYRLQLRDICLDSSRRSSAMS